ncbi:MAG: hypothetical protein ABWX88_04450 [Pseudoxanthomonas sp.]
MSQQKEVIDAYVADVMRQVPRKDRNEIGLELGDLLTEMLADRALTEGRPADDPMVLAMLREFGSPAEIAARYRPPGMVIIPAEGTRSFTLASLIGIALQWGLTLPAVFEDPRTISAWWLTWGLGSLWWPGFMAMMALAAAGLRQTGWFRPTWRPRIVDPDRINRGAMAFAMLGLVIGATLMICLPWIVHRLPGALPQVLAFDPSFLHQRAWPAVMLWLGNLLLWMAAFSAGRWTRRLRRIEIALGLAFVALLAWWLAAGDMFLAKATNDGARAALALVILIVVMDLAYRLYRRRTRIHPPKLAG